MGLIEQAIEGHVPYEAFFLKAVFTAVTLGAGYKGGEIVPTLCVGATFGCAVGMLLGFSPSLCAACGMIALFAGVTNCPVSSILIAFEMCGFEAMPYFALAVAVALPCPDIMDCIRARNLFIQRSVQSLLTGKPIRIRYDSSLSYGNWSKKVVFVQTVGFYGKLCYNTHKSTRRVMRS